MTSLDGNVNHENGIFRPEANFSPSMWGNVFRNSTKDNQISEKVVEEIEALKEEVKHMIISTTSNDIEQKVHLIDTLERLGIYYHFEKEIEHQLSKIFDLNFIHEEDDLYNVSLYFRLFRQHGYPISSDCFNQFKDTNGKFKKTLLRDVKGMLSLYEAAHVRKHGDATLEEALIFATFHLERITPNTLDSTLEKQVTHALMQSHHRGIPRAEAHFNISIYEECGSRNEKLLRLAKLDYNLVQVLHKEELSELTKWWKDLDFASKLSYVRDRMVECYFWTVGVYFEPQYSQARVMLAKCIAMISVIDDTYDSYGTLDELIIFTEVVDRWDISEVDRLPNYMKPIYTSLLDLFNEYEREINEQDRFNGVNYVKEAMKEIVRSYYIEAEWFIEGKIPSFKDYLNNALVTGTYYLLAPASLLGMKSTSKKTFDWMMNKPKILVASAIIGRVIDDIATYKIEKEKGQLVTGIECYMQENNLSVEEASAQLSEIAEIAWKDLNKECIKTTTSNMPNEILMRVVNLTRLIDVVYKNNQDGYSNPKNNVKSVIEALLVNPIDM
ncbi:vetispiradiene synthase 2-like [Solanum tuberosum]|uniref:Vetispiradiene synthase 5 n=1 Tax=Solanum tuberosum TaxID=4113 RepID=M1AYX2_SOLTU|nr:PREDICTED: vetispiradiene synthase 2-like [Solanum tuberosum]